MTTIQINERGTLTLPKNLRKMLGTVKGGIVLAEVSEEGVVLKPAVAYPIEIYTEERIAEFDLAEKETAKFVSKRQIAKKKE